MSNRRLDLFDVDHILYRIGLYLDTPPSPSPNLLSYNGWGEAWLSRTSRFIHPTVDENPSRDVDFDCYPPSRDLMASVKVSRRWMVVLYPILHARLARSFRYTGRHVGSGTHRDLLYAPWLWCLEHERVDVDERKSVDGQGSSQGDDDSLKDMLGQQASNDPKQRGSLVQMERHQLHVHHMGDPLRTHVERDVPSLVTPSLDAMRIRSRGNEHVPDASLECVHLGESYHSALVGLRDLRRRIFEERMDNSWNPSDDSDSTINLLLSRTEDRGTNQDEPRHLALLEIQRLKLQYPWTVFAAAATENAASTVASMQQQQQLQEEHQQHCQVGSASAALQVSSPPLYTTPEMVFMAAIGTMGITTLSLSSIESVDQRLHYLVPCCPQLETLSLMGQPERLEGWQAVMRELCGYIRDGCPRLTRIRFNLMKPSLETTDLNNSLDMTRNRDNRRSSMEFWMSSMNYEVDTTGEDVGLAALLESCQTLEECSTSFMPVASTHSSAALADATRYQPFTLDRRTRHALMRHRNSLKVCYLPMALGGSGSTAYDLDDWRSPAGAIDGAQQRIYHQPTEFSSSEPFLLGLLYECPRLRIVRLGCEGDALLMGASHRPSDQPWACRHSLEELGFSRCCDAVDEAFERAVELRQEQHGVCDLNGDCKVEKDDSIGDGKVEVDGKVEDGKQPAAHVGNKEKLARQLAACPRLKTFV